MVNLLIFAVDTGTLSQIFDTNLSYDFIPENHRFASFNQPVFWVFEHGFKFRVNSCDNCYVFQNFKIIHIEYRCYCCNLDEIRATWGDETICLRFSGDLTENQS